MFFGLKKILTIVFCTCYFINISAQYKFGVHGGIGTSNFRGNDFPSDNQPKKGPVGGIFYEHEINYTISLGGEINYEKKGTTYNYYPRVATNIRSDSRLEYISVPFLIKAYIDYKAYFFCYGGISGSYLINSSNDVLVTEYGYPIATAPFFNYEFRKYDASILLGFGINIKEIILNVRYQHGIVDIYKGTNSPDIKNQFITATLGFTIYKKKVLHCLNPLNRVK
jgi:hypothetical protein